MKIIFDNNVPIYLLNTFPGSSTAYREGWHELSNGNLLDAAECAGFKLLITLDQGFETQQSLDGKSISAAILKPSDQTRSSFIRAAEALVPRLPEIESGTVITVG